MGDGHEIYVEQSGHPEGVPILFLHGGPGSGCSAHHRRFFDPLKFRAILFDQRGSGRSRPAGSIEQNHTWALVSDIEKIRIELSIPRWIIFGASWGSALALTYAMNHPDQVKRLLLQGVFLMTEREMQWLYGNGARAMMPEAWEELIAPIPFEERSDIISAYHHRLHTDLDDRSLYSKNWCLWEEALVERGSPPIAPRTRTIEDDLTRAQIETHYLKHRGFYSCDGWLLKQARHFSTIPCHIIHGQLDLVCPIQTAFELHRRWPQAEFRSIPRAGHALHDPLLSDAIVDVLAHLPSG